MPKRKLIPIDEPLVSRPQRNTKAKKVFDPSDNYLPKKRNNPSVKHEEPAKTSKKNNHEKKKTHITKSKNSIPNESLLDSSCNDILDSPVHSLMNSHVEQNCSALCPESTVVCYLCTESLSKYEQVDCPFCLVTAHRNCILIDEPIWKIKFDKCVWLCKQCRKKHCSKCLKNDSLSEISHRCITCKVGLHFDCYESYDIKPMHTLQINMYICIPCMTLAVHKLPEEEDEIGEEEDHAHEDLLEKERAKSEINKKKDVEDDAITIDSSSSSVVLIPSDEEDDDFGSNKSYDSLLDFERDQDLIPNIPDISNWSKYQVYEYLTDRLPKEILTKLIKNEIDGNSLRLLKRTDVISGMGLKLGPALKLYKEVRILQTQSTYHAVFWE